MVDFCRAFAHVIVDLHVGVRTGLELDDIFTGLLHVDGLLIGYCRKSDVLIGADRVGLNMEDGLLNNALVRVIAGWLAQNQMS